MGFVAGVAGAERVVLDEEELVARGGVPARAVRLKTERQKGVVRFLLYPAVVGVMQDKLVPLRHPLQQGLLHLGAQVLSDRANLGKDNGVVCR